MYFSIVDRETGRGSGRGEQRNVVGRWWNSVPDTRTLIHKSFKLFVSDIDVRCVYALAPPNNVVFALGFIKYIFMSSPSRTGVCRAQPTASGYAASASATAAHTRYTRAREIDEDNKP